MNLMPQDIVVLLKIVVLKNQQWSLASLANELGLSSSQVHYAINRCLEARLMTSLEGDVKPIMNNVEEFLQHGVKYLCIPKRGEQTRGVPTIWAGPPLKKYFRSNELPPVWPDAEGQAKGFAFEPIHKSAVVGAKKDAQLYELLVLLDALRDGRAREKKLAVEMLKKKLKALS